MDMSLDAYLSLDDHGYNLLVASGFGSDIQDPFHGAALYDIIQPDVVDEDEAFDPDKTLELYQMSPEEKLADSDLERSLFPDE